eukprot:CAMPEP_0174856698 /NCGR_PEP_ID=MMETSP1114-20130205/36175_1 /TAXON_ID=312471 /ORGANISM="Neobodo designis, Strain CCAP 1951/1" /LENGTH=190 /DNA_ID=CAMNT_0016091503 /DNA_START=36 /DNA_END=608 /DNA_ORIENTATION=-
MIIPPRERRAAESYEVEFCEQFRAYVPKSKREKKKKTAKKKAAAKKAAAPAKAKAPKKVAAKKVAAPKPKKTTSSGSLSALAFTKRVAEARQAVAGMTREESATAQRLAEKGSLSHKWQFREDGGRWGDYAPAASVEVEKMYATWLVNPHVDVRCVKSGTWEYMVDFNLMQQQNIKHQDHKIRKVQRVAV